VGQSEGGSVAIRRALSWWYGVLRQTMAQRLPDLTARQMTLLLHLELTQPPHTVRGLAEALGFSKPAVTRALDRLTLCGFVQRQRDSRDRRSVLVELTERGRGFLEGLARTIDAAGARAA